VNIFIIISITAGTSTANKISNSTRPKVLINNPYVPQIASDLLSECCEIITIQNETREEILSKIKGVDALLWASHLKIDKDMLDAAGSQMKTIGAMSAGYDHIDLKELKKRGIKLGNTPKVLNGKELGAKFVPLEDADKLTKESDFIFVSVPLTAETEGMCNADFFAKMKKTAVFVNTSRGKVVDQKALVKALKEGQIFAAGLDVMTPEPLPPTDELLTLPNVVLMPHWGSATIKTRDDMAVLTAKNIINGLKGDAMLTPVV
ncbi:hypothetical protein NQ314_010756, partial [Rhamnusium bicolor]